MEKLKRLWYSLKGRLAVCTFVAVVGMGLIIGIYSIGSARAAQEQLYRSFEQSSASSRQQLEAVLEASQNTARTVSYSNAVQTYMLSTVPGEVISSGSPAREVLSYATQMGGNFDNIILYANNGRRLSVSNSRLDLFQEVLQDQGLAGNFSISQSFYVMEEEEGNNYLFHILPIYGTLAGNFNRESQIICGVVYDLNDLNGLLTGAGYEDCAALLVRGDSVMSASRTLTEPEEQSLGDIGRGRGSRWIDGQRYLTSRETIPGLNWDLLYMVPERAVAAGNRETRGNTILLMLAASGMLAFFMLLAMRSVGESVQMITADVERYSVHGTGGRLAAPAGEGNGQRLPRPRVRRPNIEELQVISEAVNEMLDGVEEANRREKESQRRLYEAVIAQNRAELMAYRSQINPHFLFNTLECARSMAHRYGAEPAEALISSMSQMFRYSLYSPMIVRLEDEVGNLGSYFGVMNARYPGRYQLMTSLTPEAAAFPVLSMILQPLAENAVLHAFNGRRSGCIVMVQGFIDPEKKVLVVRVADNGAGMSEEELQDLNAFMRLPEEVMRRRKDSIGLQNIFRRMKLTFGDHCHLRLRSKKGYYTVVELRIPGNMGTLFGKKEGEPEKA